MVEACKSSESFDLKFLETARLMGMDSWMTSGKRVRNAWVTCPRAGDNTSKGVLIPHKPKASMEAAGKAGDRKAWHLRMDLRPIS